MSEGRPIAHVKKNADGSWSEPQGLEEHLENKAGLAARFAIAIGIEDLHRVCGSAHEPRLLNWIGVIA